MERVNNIRPVLEMSKRRLGFWKWARTVITGQAFQAHGRSPVLKRQLTIRSSKKGLDIWELGPTRRSPLRRVQEILPKNSEIGIRPDIDEFFTTGHKFFNQTTTQSGVSTFKCPIGTGSGRLLASVANWKTVFSDEIIQAWRHSKNRNFWIYTGFSQFKIWI